MSSPVNFTLNVTAEPDDSDERLRAKAISQVTHALRRVGEALGENAWADLEKAAGKPSGDKEAFVREFGEEALRAATAKDRRDIEEEIFERLRKEREEKIAAK